MFDTPPSADDLVALHAACVVDREDERIGGIGHVYLDDRTHRPTWVAVRTGWFGAREVLVPLADAGYDGAEVQVPYTRGHIEDAPDVTPGHHLSGRDEADLARHYDVSRRTPTRETTRRGRPHEARRRP